MTNKKMWLGMLAAALTFGFAVTGCASKPAVSGDGLFEYKLSGIGVRVATITKYHGTATQVTIPPVIDGNAVWTIGEGAFEGKSLTSVVLPEGITTIENRAFANNKLTNILIPAGRNISTDLGRPRENLTRIHASSFAENPIRSFTFSGEIDCLAFDSLGSLTPYYYANGKKPGVYSVNDGRWDYNGSVLTELPAMIVIVSPNLFLQAIGGNTAAPSSAQIRRRPSGRVETNDIGYWIPAGESTLLIARNTAVGSGVVSLGVASATADVTRRFNAGMLYHVRESEDKTSVETEIQGPYSF